MAMAPEIAAFDPIELTERVKDAPTGARGGVLELYTKDTAMVEILEPDLGPAKRIVFVPIYKLRVVESTRRSRSS